MDILTIKTNAVKDLQSSYDNLQKQLHESGQTAVLTAITILQDSLNKLDRVVKLSIMTDELESIKENSFRIHQYLDLKAKLDKVQPSTEQPF